MNRWTFIRTHVLGATQQELADALGISQSTVAWWDKGRSDPKPQNIVRLRKVVELDGKVFCEHWLTTGPTQQEIDELEPEEFIPNRGGFRLGKK